MGYSGTPMVSVRNNRNLTKKKNNLFQKKFDYSKLPLNKVELDSDDLSLYEEDQKIKRRTETINRYKKTNAIKNIIAGVALLAVIIILITYT